MSGKLTKAQATMICGSDPDDITGEEGVGVELWTGADYAVARSLERRGFGTVTGPGQPKGMPGLYFNNADGLYARALLTDTQQGAD